MILMGLSITFSIVLYRVAYNEIDLRIGHITSSQLQDQPGIETARIKEMDVASQNLVGELINVNILVLIVGGVLSYFLARRSLTPIRQAHESQSRFTSDASHELRTPLATMKTELEVALRDKDASVNSLKEVLSSNLEEVDKLTKLSEMLLSLSKLDNGNIKKTPVNLAKITREALKNFRAMAKRVEINSKTNQNVLGDEIALTEVVKVLVDNALLYSPKDSKVKIDIYKQDDQVLFKIVNEGQGIERDKLEHIFERFYRADSSRTEGDQKGYGLGLSLAKNIVELHNGTIEATSTIGKKTSFTVSLPIVS